MPFDESEQTDLYTSQWHRGLFLLLSSIQQNSPQEHMTVIVFVKCMTRCIDKCAKNVCYKLDFTYEI